METVMWWVCISIQSLGILMGFVGVMRMGMGYPMAPKQRSTPAVEFLSGVFGLAIGAYVVYFLLQLRGYV